MTSPCGKSYIGQSNNLENRYRQWKNNNTVYTTQNSKIDKARKEYSDLDAWKYDVLERCEIDKLNEREEYWINHFQTFSEGYNDTKGGTGTKGWQPTEEQVKNLMACQERAREDGCYEEWYNSERLKEMTSNRFKGRTWSDEQKKQISDTLKGRKVPHETVEKQRQTMIEKFKSGYVNKGQIEAVSKTVCQYGLDGKLIKVHKSCKAAAEYVGRKDSKLIRQVCHGNRKQAYGYIWKFQ